MVLFLAFRVSIFSCLFSLFIAGLRIRSIFSDKKEVKGSESGDVNEIRYRYDDEARLRCLSAWYFEV